MKPTMKNLKRNGENLINYMKSSNQNPQSVVTMMAKLSKAYEEFQEKLVLTKNSMNEGKPSPEVRNFVIVLVNICQCIPGHVTFYILFV